MDHGLGIPLDGFAWLRWFDVESDGGLCQVVVAKYADW